MSHDYRPEDDYSVVELEGEDKEVVERAVEEARLKLLRPLELGPLTVFCVEPGSLRPGVVGTFICGTSSAPNVGLDLEAIKAGAEEYGVCWKDQVRATIAHELAHAFEESLGLEDANEEASEAFARAFVMDNVIDVEALQYALEKPTIRHRGGRR